jgi:hypothetical protein
MVGGASGFVLESLSLAVAAVLDPRRLPEVLVDVVRVGMDTGTNAAIAGGLLGVRDGAGAIPGAGSNASSSPASSPRPPRGPPPGSQGRTGGTVASRRWDVRRPDRMVR